jgi:hypothetical protein
MSGRNKRFPCLQCIKTASGAHSNSVQGIPGLPSQGVKWPGHEADHVPPCSAKVKND